MNRDIAVIGMGCVFPGAVDLGQYWSNNVNAVDAITEIPKERWPNVDFSRLPEDHDTRMTCTRGGFLTGSMCVDARRHGIMPNILHNGDPDQFLMIHVCAQALSDAGIAPDDSVRERTDVIIGRGGYMSVKMADTFLRVDLVSRVMPVLRQKLPQMSRRELAELEQQLHATLPPCEPESYVTCIPNLVASRVCNRLNLGGTAYVVDAACASSLIAVEQAVERLRGRQCDLAVASGIHLCQNPPFWFVFTHLRALSASGVCRPFDRRADGLLLGEGAGSLVLKRLEDAYRDGNRIYAVIKGAGSASDGRQTGLLAPSPEGQLRALQRAYADAGVDQQSVSFLEAHGTATLAGDPAEIETIKRFFGTSSAPTKAMGSVKSMIGHAMPAAGMASMIRTIMALSNKVLPPTLHCDEPREELRDAPFYVLDEARPWVSPMSTLRRAGVNAFGFGGINAHIVLEEAPETNPVLVSVPCARPIQVVSHRAAEPILFAADSRADLAEQCQRLTAFLEQDASECRLEDVSYSLMKQIDFAKPCKLALVCRDVDELKQKLADCTAQLRDSEAFDSSAEDVYFSVNAATPIGRVAFCFPGMAFPGLIGNFPRHMLELCLHFPELRSVLDMFEGKDGCEDDPIPFSCILSPPRSFSAEERDLLKERLAPPKSVRDEQAALNIKPHERNLSGVGMTLSNWLGYKLLDGLKIPKDLVCGQSAGDLTALSVAGVVDFEKDIFPKLWDGLNAPSMYLSRGCMAFVGAGKDKVQPYLADKPNTYVGIDISPDAVLVGGAFDEIDRICTELRKDGIMGIGLPYLPGHTPRMTYLREEIVYDVEKMLGPPKLPVYSALTVDLFPSDPAGIRELLMANLDHPVHFWQINRRLYDDGARIFIQAGCGTLASNIETLLDADDIASVAVDVESRDPVTQLAHLISTVFTAGVSFDPSFVFEHRGPRLINLDAPQTAMEERQDGAPLRLRWCFYSPKVDEPVERPEIAFQPGPEAQSLSQNRAGRRGQAHFAPKTPQNEPVLDGFGIGSKPQATSKSDPPAQGPVEYSEPAEYAEPEATGPQMPFVGTLLRLVPQEEIAVSRTLDLAEDLYLHDHHFINASTVKPMEECLPVFPMVMMMEAMAETAAHLTPGLGLIGFENIHASRWISLNDAPRTEIQIEAKLAAADDETGVHAVEARVICEGQTAASATVLLSADYRQDVEMVFAELGSPDSWPITAEQLYRDGHTFHGPRFQTVSGLDVLADNGLIARLRVLPKDDLFASQPSPALLTDPAVIDGAGQLFGSWSQTRGAYMLPVGVDKIEIYGPTPPAGTEVTIRLEVTRFERDNNLAAADMEILDGEGFVWMRIRGWRDRIFVKSNKFMDVQRLPGQLCLSDLKSLPGLSDDAVCAEITQDDIHSGSLTWVCRLHLAAEELETLQSTLGRRRSQYLLGRIAAKDAARAYLAWQAGGEMIHPASIEIGNYESGQPFVKPIAGVDVLPNISISHSDGRAVAVASAAPMGVDIEPVERETERILGEFAQPEEIEMIDDLSARQPEECWPTRLWCAKESASKTLGTGLGGQIHDYQLLSADADGGLRIRHRPSAQELVVMTSRDESRVVACSSLATSRVLEIP